MTNVLKIPALSAIIVLSFFVSPSCAQVQSAEENGMLIQAKVWSKDENKQVHYSEWKDYYATTVNMVKNFFPVQQPSTDKYGGAGSSLNKTGFFHTQKVGDRWWVVDPEGKEICVKAVNGIRLNKPNEVPSSFNSITDWADKTITQIQGMGFNTAGCWSDTASIIAFNKSTTHPIAYTTQLNLLSGYASKIKKEHPERKNNSILSFILDEDFSTYCDSRASTIAYLKNDPNLLGHFSDNELPFTMGELKEIINNKNTDDKAYQTLLASYPADTDFSTLNSDQKESFIALFAKKYYETVSKSIKKYDPNHLYIGSRIHSNAKNNKYIFQAAEAYVDIISINYYGFWQPKQDHMEEWAKWSSKPFFITEFYTKAEESGMSNLSGAGWIVKTQEDRGIHYQNFCMKLLASKNCVGWHWFRYQDNDPNDAKADDSNKDSNKGIYNIKYEPYKALAEKMQQLNNNVYGLIPYFDQQKKQ